MQVFWTKWLKNSWIYYPIRRTGRQNKWFRGTCWCEELVKKRFRLTDWCNKLFRKIGCGWKWSKKRSKCNYSLYQRNFIYWQYQRNFNRKIIHQPSYPSWRPTHYPTRHRRSEGRAREFDPAPDVSLAGKRHGCGTPLCAHFLYYWERNWDGKGPHHTKGRFFLRNEV